MSPASPPVTPPLANQKLSLVFVEELALYREALTHLFAHLAEFELLGSAPSGAAMV
jgi:hypothetical protein